MKVVLIYNSASGGNYNLRSLRELFKEADVTIDYSFTVKQLSSRKLRELIKKGVTVAAVGGDGTLNAVARMLVGTRSVLLPLSGGTFNHFVRDLGMYPTVEDNIRNCSSGSLMSVDVGYVNQELFLNNSNLGIYPFSLIERKATKKIVGKYVAAALSAIDQLTLFRRHSLKIDGKKIKSPFIFVGNNEYDIKNSLVPERTGFDKGILTIMVSSSGSRRALAGAVYDVLKGDVSRRDDFTLTKRASLTIYSDHQRLPVSIDGEVVKLVPPLVYRSEPRALRVLVVKQK